LTKQGGLAEINVAKKNHQQKGGKKGSTGAVVKGGKKRVPEVEQIQGIRVIRSKRKTL